ncbi:MAG: phosphoglycolate phosphatase, partial [Candidatus Methanomethylicota archaeon]
KLACIGDGENDLSLFKVAGFKVAVANAVEQLKKQADYVCSLPDGEGIAEFVRKFISPF